MTQFAINGPFSEADFGYELRLNPVRTFFFDWLGKRRVLCFELSKLLTQRDQSARVVTGANLARIPKPSVFVVAFVITDEQRAKANSTAVGIGESTDHEFLAVDALELQPVGRAALDVGALGPLGDHALPSSCARFSPGGFALSVSMGRITQCIVERQGLVQQTLAMA